MTMRVHDESPANPSVDRPVEQDRRRFVKGLAAAVGTAPLLASATALGSADTAGEGPGCSDWRQPGDEDFAAIVGKDKAVFIDRVLSLVENEIVPLTRKGVESGSKLFGGGVLRKSDLSTVIAATNTEAGNPLLHGEIQTITEFYALPADQRPPAKETIFITTHEPCPLCLAGITWGGFDNFFYLFSYEDTKDAFNIPHDLKILDEVFRCPDGSYSENNHYWSSWAIRDLIASAEPEQRVKFEQRVEALRQTYDELSAIYQQKKAEGTGADVPLK